MENEQALKELIAALTEKIYRLEGQVLASQVAIRALVLVQPDRENAMESMTRLLEQFAAAGLASPVAEGVLTGFQTARTRLFPSERDLAG